MFAAAILKGPMPSVSGDLMRETPPPSPTFQPFPAESVPQMQPQQNVQQQQPFYSTQPPHDTQPPLVFQQQQQIASPVADSISGLLPALEQLKKSLPLKK